MIKLRIILAKFENQEIILAIESGEVKMNYRKRHIVLWSACVCVFLTSCGVQKNPVGVYESTKGNYFNIELKSDSTFSYRSVQGLIQPVSSGSWRQKGNTISITSEKKYQSNYIELLNQEVNNSQSNKIQIVNRLEKPEEKDFIYINADYKKKYTTDENGWVHINSKVDSIDVLTLSGMQSLKLNCETRCTFIIKVVPETLDFFYFKKEKFKVKKNQLIQLDGKRVYDKK